MTTLFDIGVNLTSSAFNGRHEEVLARAGEAGVTQILLIGSDVNDSQQAIRLCSQHPGCYATTGIHPHQASTLNDSSIDTIRQLASLPQVKAIGETGLDFNRNYSPQPQQLTCFEAQLKLAAELQLPIYLHQRDAHQAFLELLKEYRSELCDAVIHCFTGNEQELDDYLALDMHIGITGWICDERRGLHLQDLIKKIPDNRLLLETDAPYLLPRTLRPKPKKGKNEPCFLPHILETASRCLNKSTQDVASQTTTNAHRFFRL
jgi:TatD DNase family protein